MNDNFINHFIELEVKIEQSLSLIFEENLLLHDLVNIVTHVFLCVLFY